jgi:arsenate reductase
MAEAIVNNAITKGWQAFSAGTQPAGYVHPKALQVLAEIGIQYHGESKSVDRFMNESFDLVITVCDSAAEECPIWLGQGLVIHHSFPDPAEATGNDEEVLNAFRQVRDDIQRVIPSLLNSST